MADTSLKRVGTISYTAMLTEKRQFKDWKKPTVLARFTEQNGASTMFTLLDDAYTQFKDLEKGRIYTLKISGSCVKNNGSVVKYGVQGLFEVRMSKTCTLTLAKEAWPLELPYSFQAFANLNQMEAGQTVDIIGRVMTVGVDGPEKKTITLFAEDMKQDVVLLGTHAQFNVDIGDVIAFKDARLTAWKIYRNVTTGFMTVIEKNPRERAGVVWPSEGDKDQPKQKAIRLNLPTSLPIDKANSNMRSLVSDDNSKGDKLSLEFAVTGKIAPLTTEFFQQDPPLTGEGDAEKYCYRATITDMTGDMHVKIWSRACTHLFGMQESRLRTLWEDGLQNENKQQDFLHQLNATMTKKWIFCCTGKVWSPDSKNSYPDINVDDVEDISA